MQKYLLFAVAGITLLASHASAYIAVTARRLTLPEVMLEFPHIAAMRIDRLDLDQGALLLKRTDTLQGKPPDTVRHLISLDGKTPDRLRGLKLGDTLVVFMGSPDNRSLVLCNGGWYLTRPEQNWERLTGFRDEFPTMFGEGPRDLAAAVKTLTLGGSITTRIKPTEGAKEPSVTVRYDAQFPHRRLPMPLPKTDAPTLIGALSDKDPIVRLAAAYTLAQHPAGADGVKALTAALKDNDRFVCMLAAYALSLHGDAAKAALPQLADALKDRDYDHDFRPHRGAEAAEAILKLDPNGPHARAAIDLLLSNRMLNDDRIDSEGTRAAAARALGRTGKAAAPALDDLRKRMKSDKLAEVRVASAEAILLIAPTDTDRADALATFKKELDNPLPGIRIQTLRAIAASKSKPLADAAKKLTQDPTPEVKTAATQTLTALQ